MKRVVNSSQTGNGRSANVKASPKFEGSLFRQS
jgi:hypothetical protein